MAVKTSFCYLWELNVEFILRFIAKNYIWRTLGSQTKTRKHQITSALDLWTTPRSQTWLRKQSQFKIFPFFGQKYSRFKISVVYYDLELSQLTVLLKFAFVFKYTFVSRGLTHYGRTIRFAALCGAQTHTRCFHIKSYSHANDFILLQFGKDRLLRWKIPVSYSCSLLHPWCVWTKVRMHQQTYLDSKLTSMLKNSTSGQPH